MSAQEEWQAHGPPLVWSPVARRRRAEVEPPHGRDGGLPPSLFAQPAERRLLVAVERGPDEGLADPFDIGRIRRQRLRHAGTPVAGVRRFPIFAPSLSDQIVAGGAAAALRQTG